jgi:hypothetical protein
MFCIAIFGDLIGPCIFFGSVFVLFGFLADVISPQYIIFIGKDIYTNKDSSGYHE